jgi:predicted PurR-regulated permease PerM
VTRENPRALIRHALAGLALTIVLLWGAYLAREALLLIYISMLFAIGLAPLVAFVDRRVPRLPRWAVILTIYLLFVGFLVGLGAMVIPPMVEQARELWSALPKMLQQGQQWLIDRGLMARELSLQEAVKQSAGGGSDAVGTVVGAIWSFFGGMLGFLTILMLSFYLLLDSDRFARSFVRLFPRAERPRVEDASRRVSGKVSAWLGGQLLLGLIIGGSAAIGLFLMGVPYFYVLALIAGIGEMIPIVGPILAAIPAVAVAFTVSPALALGVALFFLVQQQFENHVLQPKMMERQVGVSAAGVIIALLVGGTLLGVVGAILAVPTIAILQVIFEEMFPEAAAD